MTIPVFSTLLPRAIRIDGYGYSRVSALERSDMESGVARTRLTARNPLAKVTVGWEMTSDQVAIFAAWLEHYGKYGAVWFYVDLPVESGSEYRTMLARFSGEPKRSVWQRRRWLVTAELEVRDTNLLDKDALDVLLAFDGLDDLLALNAAIADLSLEPYFDAWEFDA